MLSEATYNGLMGEYLTFGKSQPFGSNGNFSKENYARDILPLFTVVLLYSDISLPDTTFGMQLTAGTDFGLAADSNGVRRTMRTGARPWKHHVLRPQRRHPAPPKWGVLAAVAACAPSARAPPPGGC
jgi:hypothetical protein